MQITIYVALSILAAGVLCDTNVITPAVPGMMMLSSNPGNSPDAPGSTPLSQQYPGEIYKWDYPDSHTLKEWPVQPTSSKRDECSLTIQVNVGKCKSGDYGYKAQFIPYDAASTKAIEGNVMFKVDHDNNKWISHSAVKVDCYWRGRVMITDTPEIQSRIGLISVRVDTSPAGSRAWVTSDPDEESKMKQEQVATISFVEYGTHSPNNVNWLGGARGFEKTLKTSNKKHDTLLIQAC